MDPEKIRWATGVVLGVIFMLLFAILTVNFFRLIPLAGPFFGGLVAGYYGGREYLGGATAGIAAGIIGAFAVSLDFMMNLGNLSATVPQFPGLAGILFFLVAVIYFPVLAFIGGAFGGYLNGQALTG